MLILEIAPQRVKLDLTTEERQALSISAQAVQELITVMGLD
jgi:hypothetical protein